MNELVQHLAHGDHPVMVGGPNPSQEEFRKRLAEIGYVFIKFTDTQGGTDLGVRVDKSATLIESSGIVHVEGTLTLNYVNVRCVADINQATLRGSGHLVVLEEVHS